MSRDFITLGGTSVLIKSITLINLIFLLKVYSPEQFATFYYVMAISAIVIPLCSLNVNLIANRLTEAAEAKSVQYTVILFTIPVSASILFFIGTPYFLYVVAISLLSIVWNLSRMQLLLEAQQKLFALRLLQITVLSELSKIVFGLFQIEGGLLYGTLVGLLIVSGVETTRILKYFNVTKALKSLLKHTKFILSRYFVTLTQNLSISLVPIITFQNFSRQEAGLFLTGLTLATLPSQVFGKYINEYLLINFRAGKNQALRIIAYMIGTSIFVYVILRQLGLEALLHLVFASINNQWVGAASYVSNLILLGIFLIGYNACLQYFYTRDCLLRYANLAAIVRLLIVITLLYILLEGYIVLLEFALLYGVSLGILFIFLFVAIAYDARRTR